MSIMLALLTQRDAVKPPFAYFGGKTGIGEAIARLMPPHQHYVEPFAGGLAVLLAKAPVKLETVNDLDGDLMTFWRVLRDQPEALAHVCALTPHSRTEYTESMDGIATAPTDLERARLVWTKLAQGRGGMLRRTGWRYFQDPNGTSVAMPGYLDGYVARIAPAAARLRNVSLECRDALDVIRDYGRFPTTLIYADPPYLGSTRIWGNQYRHELRSEDDHRELAAALRDVAATVMLSGYPSPLYDDLYDGWHRIDMAAWTGNATPGTGDRTEVIWSNRPLHNVTEDLFSAAESA